MATTKEKMLTALEANKGGVAFTTRQAQARYGIVGVRQRINDLRNEGFKIVTYRRPGQRTVAYGLRGRTR